MDHAPSLQQQAIFRYFAKDLLGLLDICAKLGLDLSIDVEGHLVIRALAGTGKTTTILEAIGFAPEDAILICAFGADIAAELKKRCKNPRAEAKSLHGTGNGLVSAFLSPRPRIDKDGLRKRYLTDAALSHLWQTDHVRLPVDIIKLVTKLATKGREIVPLATEPGALLDIAYDFECEPDPKWARAGYGVELVERLALYAMKVAAEDLDGIKRTGIDFTDMIFLPVRNGWMAPLYNMVVVDEAQDMSASQLLLAQGVLAPGGRMVVVGDPNQAIFGFRGADSTSIDRLKRELNAGELGLTTTYRCDQIIAEYCAQWVPDFRSGSSLLGSITTLYGVPALVTAAEYGDFVVSRKNAPIAGIAMALLRANKRCVIRGKQFGDALISLTVKLADKADSIPDFLKRLQTWKEKEIDRAFAAGKDERVEGIIDKAETLMALAEGVVGLKELQDRIATLFADDGTGDAGRVTLSSIHKAKGLEANRVFVLVETLFPKFKGMTEARRREEANLAYVANSRARHELIHVYTSVPAPAMAPAPLTHADADASARLTQLTADVNAALTADGEKLDA